MSCDKFTVDDVGVPLLWELKTCSGDEYPLEGGETAELVFTSPSGETFTRVGEIASEPNRVSYLTAAGEFAKPGTWSVMVWVLGPGAKKRRSLCAATFSVRS